MSKNKSKLIYDLNEHIIEIYDNIETETHDIEFILDYIKDKNIDRILEPFCGNGRMLIPLAEAGYQVVGMDLSFNMLDSLKKKINNKEKGVKENIKLIQADILEYEWPENFDLLILGCNCLYELASPKQQLKIIQKAYNSLKEDGLLFIDNDNMEGKLDESWCEIGREKEIFPNGICQHGIEFKGTYKTTYVNREKRIWKAERKVEINYPDGKKDIKSLNQQKHPVSAPEVKNWLKDTGFEIIKVYSDLEKRKEFIKGANRATFLAKNNIPKVI